MATIKKQKTKMWGAWYLFFFYIKTVVSVTFWFGLDPSFPRPITILNK